MALFQKWLPFLRSAILGRNPALKQIAEADLVGDIRGGDSFSDIYGVRGFVLGSLPAIIALLLGKKLVLFPQTYGPYSSRTARVVARWILLRSGRMLSRDAEGRGVVHSLLSEAGRSREVKFCPDVAFALDSVPVAQPDIQPPLDRKVGTPLVGFNINGLLYNGGYTRDNMFGLAMDYKAFVHQLAEELVRKTDAHFLLIPHTFAPFGHVESDNEASQRVLTDVETRYPGRIHLVSREYDQSEIKTIIGICDFFIGSRMHACIAALSQGVPAVGVAYSRKFKGVFDSAGVGEVVVDARSTSTEDAIAMIMKTFDERASLKSILVGRSADLRALLFDTFRNLTDTQASSQRVPGRSEIAAANV
jgi:polysaccharide pyruvyl transferase WcaK-like protein